MPIMKRFASPDDSNDGYTFWCPGCREIHAVWTKGRLAWAFNGNEEKPTFTPSLLLDSYNYEPPVTYENYKEFEQNPWPQQKVRRICHSYIIDGNIVFLGDCTHGLAGQTVPLPDMPGRD